MTRPARKKPPLKHLIVYGMWQKPDMVPWLINCIRRRTDQHGADVLFIFDTHDPAGVANYDRLCGSDARVWDRLIFENEIRELGVHNVAIDYALEREYGSLLVFQDDMGILQKDLLRDVERVYDALGDNTGVIGGRDGFDWGEYNIRSSIWSNSLNVSQYLGPGEYSAVELINSGPVIYKRSVLEKVGKLDEEFYVFDVWKDYALRCIQAGLTNVLLGTNIVHEAFGSLKASTFYDSEKSARDHNLIEKKYQEHLKIMEVKDD